MAKKLILNVLALVALLARTDNTFADGEHQWNGFYHRDYYYRPVMVPPLIGPVAFPPSGGIMIDPTIDFTTTGTVEEKIIVVWITNNNGSETEVRLITTADGGWTGPKGEYYSSMPTEEQLKAVYGLPCTAPIRNNIIVYLGRSGGIETVVVLTKDGSEYVGPKSERYESMPTEEQLRAVYGS
jgi:hypothetical protein